MFKLIKFLSLFYFLFIVNISSAQISLDKDFGDQGFAYSPIDENHHAVIVDLVIDNNKRIIAVGEKRNSITDPKLCIIRYLDNGEIDTDFGTKGIIEQTLPDEDVSRPFSADIDKDNNLYVVGNYNNYAVIYKYTSLGDLDNNFGNQGILIDYAIQIWTKTIVNDKILVVGVNDNGICLKRYNLDGTPDTFFGNNGITSNILPSSNSSDLKILSNGRILLTGNAFPTRDGLTYRVAVVMRFLPDGVLDKTFGTDGITEVDFSPGSHRMFYDEVYNVAELSDKKILIAGANPGMLSARFNPDGSLDNTYGQNGLLKNTNAQGAINNCLIAFSNNELLTISRTRKQHNNDTISTALQIIKPNGEINYEYGNQGIMVFHSPVSGAIETIPTVVKLLDNNKIILGGYLNFKESRPRFMLMRTEVTSLDVLEQNEVSQFTAYPNPSVETLYFNPDCNNFDISVFNTLGELVLSKKIEHSNELNIKDLPPGQYTYQIIKPSKETIFGKFIKAED